MATGEGVPAAHQVSDAFVEQYFRILEQIPHEAIRLYIDSSVVSRPAPDGTMLSFTSLEAIKEQFVSRDYENTAFEVVSVDSQSSMEDGIFIMVIGFLTGLDNLKRKFSQLFYLARDANSTNNAYVVLNDIFRYVDDEASTPVVEPVPATEKASLNKTNVSAEISVNAAEVKKVVSGATPPLENGNIVEASDEKAHKPKESVAETAAAPPLAGAKKSFAAIVQSLASNAAPFQVKSPVPKPKYTGQPRAARQATASVSNSERKKDQKIIDEPGTSIFVANLPMNAMPPQLHELFKGFGPIKENGIQVRSSRGSNNGICYGFVAFESAASVQSVLQAAKDNPFMLGDRTLRVKEKQVDYEGGKPSGRSGGVSRTQNGSADGGDEFRRSRNRRNNGGRTERRGDRNANGGESNQKSSEGGGGAPE